MRLPLERSFQIAQGFIPALLTYSYVAPGHRPCAVTGNTLN